MLKISKKLLSFSPFLPLPVALYGLGRLGLELARTVTMRGRRVVVFEPCPQRRALLPNFEVYHPDDFFCPPESFRCFILAVKPSAVPDVCRHINEKTSLLAKKESFLISAAAGVSLAELQEALPGMGAYARCMPQVTLSTGKGIVPCVSEKTEAVELMKELFSPNLVMSVKESQLNEITLLSGAGPAFFAWVAERLRLAVGTALSPEEFNLLLGNTLRSTGEAFLQTPELTPRELMSRVASPGGVTEKALQRFSTKSFRTGFRQALAKMKPTK